MRKQIGNIDELQRYVEGLGITDVLTQLEQIMRHKRAFTVKHLLKEEDKKEVSNYYNKVSEALKECTNKVRKLR